MPAIDLSAVEDWLSEMASLIAGNPAAILVLIAGVLAAVLLLEIAWRIVRLLRDRPYTFGAWRAPYRMLPAYDPNAEVAIRQGWQAVAQNDAFPLPCAPESYAARKRLVDERGRRFGGWAAVGARVYRFDPYGRIARTEWLLSPRLMRLLTRAARKSGRRSARKNERYARAFARRVARHWFKVRDLRLLPLPMAFEFRWKAGRRAAVEMEVCRCDGAGWEGADRWFAPLMPDARGGIEEQFTYTFFGQQPYETAADFQRRLRDDWHAMFAGMFLSAPMAAPLPVVLPPTTPIAYVTASPVMEPPRVSPPTVRTPPVTRTLAAADDTQPIGGG